MIRPLHDKILLKVLKEEQKKGSLFLPDADKSTLIRAEVLNTGPGEIINGHLKPPEVAPRDIVLISRYIGTTIPNDEGLELILVHEKQILGMMEGDDDHE